MQLKIPGRENTQTDIFKFWQDIRSVNLGLSSCQLSVNCWGSRAVSFEEVNDHCTVLQTYDLTQLISSYCAIELDMIDSLSKMSNVQGMLMTRQIGIETLRILENLYEQTEEIIRRKNCFVKIFIFIRELFSRCFDEALKDIIYLAKQNFLSFNFIDFHRVFSEPSRDLIHSQESHSRYIVEEQQLIQKISELQFEKKEEKADTVPTVSSEETAKYREINSNRGGSMGNITQAGASIVGSMASSVFGGDAFKHLVIPESPRMRLKNRGFSVNSFDTKNFDIKSIGSQD